jgi:hypothetical protein
MPTPPPDSHPREYGNNNDGYGWKTPKGSRVKTGLKRKPVKKTKRARKISPARQPNFNSTTTLRARANSYSEMLEKMEHLNEARAMGEPGYAEVELKRKN